MIKLNDMQLELRIPNVHPVGQLIECSLPATQPIGQRGGWTTDCMQTTTE
jgi:hypothetical protein